MAALHAGAVEIVRKPTALATERLREISDALIRAVGAAAIARRPDGAAPIGQLPVLRQPTSRKVVVIGASTGGPQALRRVVGALPKDFPVPMALVLHLPPGYTEAFARRLHEECAVEVLEASADLELLPGRVIVARAGLHLKLRRDGTAVRAVFDAAPVDVPHRPSVDVLFRSAAEVYGAGVLGVVLTGMGDDGLQGARAIHAAGGELVTEAEASCVVYGMPRSVDEAGLSSAKAPISLMAQTILQRL
jgi:two-component system chemotaxis response regulator CheB